MDFTKRLKNESFSYGLTVNEKAMADLIAIGWKVADAYLVVFGVNPGYSDNWHKQKIQEITERNDFVNYYHEAESNKKKIDKEIARRATMEAAAKAAGKVSQQKKEIDSHDGETFLIQEKPLTKEDVTSELIRTIRSLPVEDPKRADVLMKYADLTQMKKSEDQSEDKFVHFYLPLSCKQCELWKKNQK